MSITVFPESKFKYLVQSDWQPKTQVDTDIKQTQTGAPHTGAAGEGRYLTYLLINQSIN